MTGSRGISLNELVSCSNTTMVGKASFKCLLSNNMDVWASCEKSEKCPASSFKKAKRARRGPAQLTNNQGLRKFTRTLNDKNDS